MYKSRSFAASGILPWGTFVAGLVLCGCEKSDQITTYTVPKHDSLQSTAYLEQQERQHPQPKRMIGIIIPRESLQWFFKLEGNVAAVAARENDVREFLKSLRFSSPEVLEWTLPSGWKQTPGNDLRYATILLDGAESLEMSVTKLPTRPELPVAEQVAANVNRWRNQLSLPPIQEEDLDHQTEKLHFNDLVAYWVNLVGRSRPKPASMTPPMGSSSNNSDDRSTAPAQRRSEAEAQKTSPNDKTEPAAPVFERPAEWTEAPATMFAKVSLQAFEGDAKVGITVTPARGDPLANVNRWRGQVQQEPLTPEGLASAAKPVEVGKLTGNLYEMTNGTRTILGVIVEDRGQTWFVKLDGNTALAERERPRFVAFLKSLQLE